MSGMFREHEVQVILTFMVNSSEVPEGTTVEQFAIDNYADYEHETTARITWVSGPKFDLGDDDEVSYE
jgi:hypothetical protein